MRWSLLVLATLAVCAGLAQSDEPRLIKLNVAAIDAKGDPVTDLKANELFVLEDGRPRHIAFFRFTGSKRPFAAPAPGEFASRRAPPPTIILLDRLNERLMTAAMASTQLSQALKGLETAAGVYIYILTNHGDLHPVRPIPGTDAEVLAAVQTSPTQRAALLDGAVKKLRGFRDDDELDLELRFNATSRALNALGGQMTSIAGRKSLIWITHGLPLVERATRDLAASAALSEIAIYTVDQSGQGAGAEPDEFRATLQLFSDSTGGRWFQADSAARAIATAMTDSRGNYTIAYYSQVSEKDQKFHPIHLESARKGVRFQTRDGYNGDNPQPHADAIEEAIVSAAQRSPLDASEIGIRVALTSDSKAKTARFRIRIDPEDLLLVPRNNHYQGHLRLMLASYSGDSLKTSSRTLAININFTEDQFQHAAKDGLVVPQDLKIPDHVQKVRVIVFDRGLRSVGSVTVPITAP